MKCMKSTDMKGTVGDMCGTCRDYTSRYACLTEVNYAHIGWEDELINHTTAKLGHPLIHHYHIRHKANLLLFRRWEPQGLDFSRITSMLLYTPWLLASFSGETTASIKTSISHWHATLTLSTQSSYIINQRQKISSKGNGNISACIARDKSHLSIRESPLQT